MKNRRMILLYAIYILLGGLLFALGTAEVVDSFWGGMGAAFLFVGALRMIRMYRLRTNEEYREAVEVEISDERNRFLRNKAWAWAGYLYIMITGILVILLKVMGQEQLHQMAACGVCLMLVLYWGSYFVLRKKY